jgi:hypothetical protein
MVDEDRMLILSTRCVAIPEKSKRPSSCWRSVIRIIARAQEEANRTLAIAREKSDQLVERDAIVQAAQAR